MQLPQTVGQLRTSGYKPVGVKEEMRRNLQRKLRQKERVFSGLIGYDDTVLPEVFHAILARHDLLLLGTRGQGKTRLLRGLVDLLNEAVPALAGCDLRDDPFCPISAAGRRLVAELGDEAPVIWLNRDQRYGEKLATPDVSMADLFGDIDLMRHVQGQSLAEEGALQFGLIPRCNRGIFCINELPDLSPKIQVGLFNLLQERDVQIRGHAVRFSLDICLIFSANPEDYTSRGRIVTPLKDRIGSVVRTHDPKTRAFGMAINQSSAWVMRDDRVVIIPRFLQEIIEETARRARRSPLVNQQSGVSARLGIAALELLVAAAERRLLPLEEFVFVPRVIDLDAILAGARGKMEVLTVDEVGGEGEDRLLGSLLQEALRAVHAEYTDLTRLRPVRDWFQKGGKLTAGDGEPSLAIVGQAASCPELLELARNLLATPGQIPDDAPDHPGLLASAVEFLLEGLYLGGQIGKEKGPGTFFASQAARA